MFLDTRPAPTAPSFATTLLASAMPHPSISAVPHPSVTALPHLSVTVQRKALVARALGMRGLEALLYLSHPEPSPRPMITALLNTLDIRGINT